MPLKEEIGRITFAQVGGIVGVLPAAPVIQEQSQEEELDAWIDLLGKSQKDTRQSEAVCQSDF
jgi:hypothetical protein